MKVYVVEMYYPYEDSEVVGVYATSELADTRVERLRVEAAKRPYETVRYTSTEYEVETELNLDD